MEAMDEKQDMKELEKDNIGPSEDNTTVVEKEITQKDKVTLQTRLEQYEAMLSRSPEDPIALEGAAVTLVELGQYERASSLLKKLTKASDSVDFEVLRGLTNSLLAAKKPNEAVQVLLLFREQLNNGKLKGSDILLESKGNLNKKTKEVDPILVDLLPGKAFSDLGHVSDAVAVYDQLISKYPNDFRGYLAKGIILKESGNVGDAERMFIQARFFAPEKGKALVDRYSRK